MMTLFNKRKCLTRQFSAFTLAETLITLSIIGVVAALTIPILTNKINAHRFQSANKKVQSVMAQALMKMNADQVLGKQANTSEFIDEFSKYVRIIQKCPSNDLSNCYAEKFLVNGDGYELSNITSSNSFGKNWDPQGDVGGIILNDGTSMLITYNPSCENSENYSSAKVCVGAFFDLNGIKNTNKFLGNGMSDLGTFNATFANAEPELDCGTWVWDEPGFYVLNGPDGHTMECVEQNVEADCEIGTTSGNLGEICRGRI